MPTVLESMIFGDVTGDTRDKRIAELEAALKKIASCEKRCDGDVVDIARQALEK